MSRTARLTRALVVLLFTFCIGLDREPAEARPVYQLSMSISPTSGYPGTVVTVSGSGWTSASTGNLIYWDAQSGTPIGAFDANPNGAFSTTIVVPSGAGAGAHTIWACDRCSSPFALFRPRWASAAFTVILPPTRAPTATPVPPTECDVTGMAGEVLIDFEAYAAGEDLRGTETEEGIRFLGENNLLVVSPDVQAHSGAQALTIGEMLEFGSQGEAVRIGFRYLQDFVGMYIGLNAPVVPEAPLTAVLTAYRFECARDAVTGEELCQRVVAGSDSVQLGPAPTPVEECLFVAAPGIFEVTLAYDGGEPELLDDLVLRGPEEPVPVPQDNAPPVVVITDPFEGETFASAPVRLQGTVREDFELDRRMTFSVNGGPAHEVVASGFSPSYAFAADLGPADLIPNSLNTVAVTARDAAGNEGSDTVVFFYAPPPTPTPTPSLDIIVEAMEITQVIQCLDEVGCPDNSIPLFVNKPTLVRAYLRAEGAAGDIAGVGGELCYSFSPEAAFAPVECIRSHGLVGVTTTDDPVRDHRGDIGRTLNFYLPQAWTQMRDTQMVLRVVANPGGETAAECCFDNNEAFERVTFYKGRRLNVVALRANIDGERIRRDQVGEGLQWLLRYYPTSDIHIYGHSVDPIDGSWDLTTTKGWRRLLHRLDWIRFWTHEGFSSPRYHALVDPDTPYRSSGIAWVPDPDGRWFGRSSASVWLTLFGLGDNVGHELGHNHGLHHSPGGCGEANTYDGYPQYLDPYTFAPYPRVSIGAWGIDLYQGPPVLYDPRTTPDLMSYCGNDSGAGYTNPVWMSIYTYQWLLNAINQVGGLSGEAGRAAPLRLSDPPEVLAASGEVTPDSVRLDPPTFYRVPLPAGESLTADEGEYRIELQGANGQVIGASRFRPLEDGDSEAGGSGPFFLVVPWAEGTQQIVFRYGDRLLGSVSVSAASPTVTLLEPNGGERWDEEGTARVRWEAADADGDRLTGVVQYSADDGVTWTAVAVEAQDGEAEIGLAGLPGSGAARVRVCVSDGVNTACDESDGPFTVPPKAPAVYLTAPEEGQVFAAGELVVMQGLATDAEDGSIEDGGAYAWTSSRDGELGVGPSLWGLPLSTGRHRITLTVTDSDGQSGDATVSIVVGGEGAAEREAGQRPWVPPRWIGAILFCLAGLLGAGLTLFFLWDRSARRA